MSSRTSQVELREEPPGGDAGRFLRSVYRAEVEPYDDNPHAQRWFAKPL